jgi:16S rRNA (adenine1518-N6/adenine1519-N6)-dimethyltransferase
VTSPLLDPTTIRALASEIGLRPSKQRGQNFVVDANTVRRIVRMSGVGAEDTILEVGPGLGSLTLGLLETGAKVVAVEIEDALAELLPRTVAAHQPDHAANLTVINADALEVRTLSATPAGTPGTASRPTADGPGNPPTLVAPSATPGAANAPTALVANLPYNVSVPVLLHLLETFHSWTKALVMVQLEVADRLVAPPGSRTYGVPSAKLAWYAAASRVGTVPANVFWPVPNVESGLVAIERRDPPETTATREHTFAVVDAAFSQRRKMLRSALAPLFGSQTSEILTAAGVDPTARGETLGIASFARIAEHL